MITKDEASELKRSYRKPTQPWNPIWTGETFADAVIRMFAEIRNCASGGSDQISSCFNPLHVPVLLTILKQHGFTNACVNSQANFRLDVNW